MKKLSFGLLALAGGFASVACTPAAAYKPDDGRDDRGQLQAAIDRLSAAGGGTLQLERGTYDIALPLYLRSAVHIAGRGRDTIITNRRFNNETSWFGTIIFAGNLTPGSYSDDMGEGYPGRPVRRLAADEVELERCAQKEVATLPGRVVWLSSREATPGRMGRRKPVHGEFTAATGVSGCRIRLQDRIDIPPEQGLLLHWSDGSRALPVADHSQPNAPIRDAGLRNIQIESAAGQAMIGSGCYRCSFVNVHFGKTRRLIPVQGMRHTRFQGITGFFTERGIELAMFAKDNIVEDVDAELRGRSQRGVAPPIRFGEYARDNVLRNINLRLGEAYVGRDKIRFDASAGNRLENIRLTVPRDDRRPRFLYRAPGAERGQGDVLPPGTVLRNVKFCFDEEAGQCVTID
ncbi:MAG TPA: hypothetical protein VGW34_03715 [Allosphingosinicella sp.]|nr:hypothetical protein [Allosphingosinicella sp.]